MKNRFFTFSFFFIPILCFSQKNTFISLKTGINYLYYTNFDDTFTPVEFGRFSRGYCLGLAVKKELSTTCFVESGIYYEWKKHNALENMPSGSLGLLTNKFNYLTVPLTIGYQTKKGNYFISAGPFVSLLVNNENRYAEPVGGFSFVAGAKSYILTRDIVQRDKFKNSDGGITLAFGKYFSLYKAIKFSVEARSNFGLVDINTKSNLLTFYSTKEVIKTFTPCLLIAFSYKFEAKQKT